MAADTELGPNYMSNVELANTYMCIWVRLTDVPEVAFLVPKETENYPQLIGFHILIPIGYIDYAPLFCAATEMVKDRAINTLHARGVAPEHPPETPTEELTPDRDAHQECQDAAADNTWSKLPPHASWEALAQIEVYLENFIGFIQGGPAEQTQKTHHLFRSIDELFCPNNARYRAQEEPISLKKLAKGDARWSTTNTVLNWAIDNIKLVLTLPQAQKEKPSSALERVTQWSKTISKRKWFQILVLLRNAVPDIPGETVMFSRLQQSLKCR